MDELNTKITQFQTALQEFYTSTGIEALMKTLVDFGTKIINFLNSMPKLFGKIPTTAIGMIATMVSSIKTAISALLEWIIQKVQQSHKKLAQKTKQQAAEQGEADADAYATARTNKTQLAGSVAGSLINLAGTTAGTLVSNQGVGQMISGGTGVVAGAILAATGNPLAGVTSILSGIANLANGLINKAKYDLEALENEAQELHNAALLAKDDYKNLDDYVEKYNKLQESQFDSADAAEDFIDVQNEIAETYPELIQAYDAQGNAIIDASNAEETLAQLRKKTAEATYDAAVKEAEVQEEKVEDAKEAISDRANAIVNSTSSSELAQDLYIGNDTDIMQEPGTGWVYSIDSSEWKAFDDQDAVQNLITQRDGALENLKSIIDTGTGAEIYLALKSYEDINKKIVELTNTADNQFSYGDSSSLDEDAKDYYEAVRFLNSSASKVISSSMAQNSIISDTQYGKLGEYYSIYEDNSALFSVISKQLADQWAQGDFGNTENITSAIENEDYKNAEQEYLQAVESWYDNQSDAKKELVETIFGDSSTYGAEEAIALLGLDPSTDSEIIALITNWYSETSQTIANRMVDKVGETFGIVIEEAEDGTKSLEGDVAERFDNLTELVKNEEAWTQDEETIITSVIEEAESLESVGLTESTKKYLDSFASFWNTISNLSTDQQLAIKALMLSADLTTSQGIRQFTQDLKNLDIFSDGDFGEIESGLTTMAQSVVDNIILGFGVLESSISSASEKLNDMYTDLSKSMDFSDALEKFNTLTANGVEGSFTDFFENDISDPTKWVFKSTEALQTYQNAIIGQLQTDAEELQKKAESVSNDTQLKDPVVEAFKNASFFYDEGAGTSKEQQAAEYYQNSFLSDDQELKKLIDEAGLSDAIISAFVNGTTAEDLSTIIQKQIDSIGVDAENAQIILQEAIKHAPLFQPIASGEFQKALDELASIYTTEDPMYTVWENYINETAQKQYQSMLDDFIEYGSEYVTEHMQSYGADVQTMINNWNIEDSGVLNARNLALKLNEDGRFSSKEEFNEAYSKAVEADFEHSASTIKDALGNLNFYGSDNAATASLDNIEKLANALNIKMSSLIGDLNEDGTYDVNLELVEFTLKQIPGYEQLILENTNKNLNSLVDTLKNAFSGKLDLTETNDLIDTLANFGIVIDTNSFLQTAEGFKLIEIEAYKIVAQLSKMDYFASQSAITELASSLSDSDESLGNIFSVDREIQKLTEEIATAEGDKKNTLEAQLAVYRQIRKELASTDNSFNFMQVSMPEGYDAPLDALTGVYDAFSVLNGDNFSDGYIEVEDFYQMVNFLGDEGVATMMDWKNNTDAMHNLIVVANKTLTEVDGKGMVDLSKLGEDFQIGADSMKTNITAGMKSFAQGQIEIIDGEIALLENVATMEEAIDSIKGDDGIFDIDDLFKGEWTENKQTIWTSVMGILGKDFEIGGKTLQKWYDSEFSGMAQVYQQALFDFILSISSIDWSEGNVGEATSAYLNALNSFLYSQNKVATVDMSKLNEKVTKDSDEIIKSLGEKLGEKFSEEAIKEVIEENGGVLTVEEIIDKILNPEGNNASEATSAKVQYATEIVPQITVNDDGVPVDSEGNPFTKDTLQQEIDKIYGEGTITVAQTVEGNFTYTTTIDGQSVTYSSYSDLINDLQKQNEEDSSETQTTTTGINTDLVVNPGKIYISDDSTALVDGKLQLTETIDTAVAQVTNLEIQLPTGSSPTISGLNTGDDDNSTFTFPISTATGEVTTCTISVLNDNYVTDTTEPKITGFNSATGEVTEVKISGQSFKVTPKDEAKSKMVADLPTTDADSVNIMGKSYTLELPKGEDGTAEGTLVEGSDPVATSDATLKVNSYVLTFTDENGQSSSITVEGEANLTAIITNLTKGQEGGYTVDSVTGEVSLSANTTTAETEMQTWWNSWDGKEVGIKVKVETPDGEEGSSLPIDNKGYTSYGDGLFKTEHNTTIRQELSESKSSAESATTALTTYKTETIATYSELEKLAALGQPVSQEDIQFLLDLQQALRFSDDETAEGYATSEEIGNLVDKFTILNNVSPSVMSTLNTLSTMNLAETATNLDTMLTDAQSLITLEFDNFASLEEATATAQASVADIAQKISEMTGRTITINVQETGSTTNPDGSTTYTTTYSFNTDNLMSAVNDVQSATASVTEALKKIADAMDAVPTDGKGATAITNTGTAIKDLPSSKSVKINATGSVTGYVTLKVRVAALTGNTTISGSLSKWQTMSDTLSGTSAKGNVALAKGTKTLMGELGPELVVSDGKYFTVGDNGAEFVDLPDDAIVFNHLQTKKLLTRGHSSRGSAVTNEKRATSYAKGNAMASASEAIKKLQEIRALWEGLLNTPMSDIGKKAGSGGGGGGGGGGSSSSSKAVTHDLERWYNLLRQIAKYEKQITLEQAERKNINDGYKYVDSLEEELSILKKQKKAYEDLASIQKDWYENRRKDLLATDYAKIFTYDEQGLMQYVDGENRGLDILAKLNLTDANGNPTGTGANSDAQIAYLKSIGFDVEKYLRYGADGTKAENNDTMMTNFWNEVDTWVDELDGLYDDYYEHLTDIEKNISYQNDILREYIDNQLEVEDELKTAIEDREQAVIDKLEDLKEATEEASQEYIEGLTDALSKEQDLYNQATTDKELTKLQRQLAILQRSGGSASEIKSLQDQIDSQMQTNYFDAMQKQIDTIQEASDNELEKLQQQIDIANEALTYQKENGLLWQEVYDMMNNWTPEQMLEFIQANTQFYREDSALSNQDNSDETRKKLEIWAAKRDSSAREQAWNDYYSSLQYEDGIKSSYASAAQEAFNEGFNEKNAEEGAKRANEVYENALKAIQEDAKQEETKKEETTTTTQTETGISKGTVKTSGSNLNIRKSTSTSSKSLGKIPNGATIEIFDEGGNGSWYKVRYNGITGYASKKYIKKYAQGGLVDFTGPAWVDGTKSKPEAFLSAEDTALLKSKLFSNSDYSLRSCVEAIASLAENAQSIGSTDNSQNVNIESISIQVGDGTISSDYSARRAGQEIMDEIVSIARKSGNLTLSRR